MGNYDENHRAFITHPDYPAIEAKAAAQGFRKATSNEVRASAEKRVGYPDLFCAFGGLWVKAAAAA